MESLGAEGLIPMRTLPDDDYEMHNFGLELYGETSGRTFAFGYVIKARLEEASPISGGLIFKYVDENEGVDYYEKGLRGSFRRKERKKDKSAKPKKPKSKTQKTGKTGKKHKK